MKNKGFLGSLILWSCISITWIGIIFFDLSIYSVTPKYLIIMLLVWCMGFGLGLSFYKDCKE